jgi:hypothetical protein
MMNYQAFIWKNSLVADTQIPFPIGHGWYCDNGVMIPTLMTQDVGALYVSALGAVNVLLVIFHVQRHVLVLVGQGGKIHTNLTTMSWIALIVIAMKLMIDNVYFM